MDGDSFCLPYFHEKNTPGDKQLSKRNVNAQFTYNLSGVLIHFLQMPI